MVSKKIAALTPEQIARKRAYDKAYDASRRDAEHDPRSRPAMNEDLSDRFYNLYTDNPYLAVRVWMVRFMLEQRGISIQLLAKKYMGKHGRWYVHAALNPKNFRPDGTLKPKSNNNSIPWAVVHKRLDEIETAITLWTIDNPGSMLYGSKEARDEMRHQLDGPSEIKEMFPDGRRG